MRAQLYRLAAALFDDPAVEDEAALRPLMARIIYRSPVDARWVPPLLEIAEDHTSIKFLCAEWERIFTGSGVPPFSACWFEGELGRAVGASEITMLMNRYDRAAGAHTRHRPDHIVSELELMSRLVADPDPAVRASEARFFQNHLAVWVPRFAVALRSAHPARRLIMASLYLDRLIVWESARRETPLRGEGRSAVAHA
jgi:TorA maturation chaperone TorD